MTFEMGFVLTAIGMIVTCAVCFGKLLNRTDDDKEAINWLTQETKEENEKLWKQITKCRDWEASHDKETSEKRAEYDRELSRLRENAGVKDGKLDSILEQIKEIKERLDK